jgi:hypothetical protein
MEEVPFITTPDNVTVAMLELAAVNARDFLIDLGSGDGRTVITAAKRGINALGIEYNPDMVELSRRAAEKEGVSAKAKFEKADLFETDFSKAQVITMFLLPDINRRLRPKILDLKPGVRVVSNTFDMGDWTPDETAEAGGDCTSYCRALLWIVPAKVEGRWTSADGEVALEPRSQMLTGSVRAGGSVHSITQGKVNGENIAFTAGGVEYSARINGNAMDGKAKGPAGEKASRPSGAWPRWSPSNGWCCPRSSAPRLPRAGATGPFCAFWPTVTTSSARRATNTQAACACPGLG